MEELLVWRVVDFRVFDAADLLLRRLAAVVEAVLEAELLQALLPLLLLRGGATDGRTS